MRIIKVVAILNTQFYINSSYVLDLGLKRWLFLCLVAVIFV